MLSETFRGCAHQTQQAVESFVQEMVTAGFSGPYGPRGRPQGILSKVEQLQILNHAPSKMVELYTVCPVVPSASRTTSPLFHPFCFTVSLQFLSQNSPIINSPGAYCKSSPTIWCALGRTPDELTSVCVYTCIQIVDELETRLESEDVDALLSIVQRTLPPPTPFAEMAVDEPGAEAQAGTMEDDLMEEDGAGAEAEDEDAAMDDQANDFVQEERVAAEDMVGDEAADDD